MNQKHRLLLFISLFLTLFAAFGLMCFLQLDARNARNRAEQAGMEAEEALQAVYLSEPEETKEEEQESERADSAMDLLPEDPAVIWVGDSRTVGMQKAMGQNTEDIFIAESGEGYEWFAESGLPQLETALAAEGTQPVVFNLGVNDDENLDNYLALYRTLLQEYPDTVFWFLSVNPVDPSRCSAITNEEIVFFNEKIRETFPDRYLDSYSRLSETGAETVDGIHYSEEVYRSIYVFVKNALLESQQRRQEITPSDSVTF